MFLIISRYLLNVKLSGEIEGKIAKYLLYTAATQIHY